METKVKLGIIGTGLAAKNLHLPALKKLQEYFEITAVCNHTPEKAKLFSEMVGGVPYYQSYNELLKQDIDAVDISLPIDLNYEVTLASLKAGKHVFLEKPIAANMKEAAEMLQFPQKFEKVMIVAENFRYRKVFNRLKEIIESGEIGQPYAAQWNLFYGITTENEYAATKWRQNHQYPGGFITDAGVHNVAALRSLFGEVVSVSALSKCINPAIGQPDTTSMMLKFDSSVQVIFNIFFSVSGYWENKFLIFGSKGTIETNENQIKISDKLLENCDEDGGYYSEFLDFYYAITKNTPVKSTFKEAYRDLEVIMKALVL